MIGVQPVHVFFVEGSSLMCCVYVSTLCFVQPTDFPCLCCCLFAAPVALFLVLQLGLDALKSATLLSWLKDAGFYVSVPPNCQPPGLLLATCC